jgi:hypothetical protein
MLSMRSHRLGVLGCCLVLAAAGVHEVRALPPLTVPGAATPANAGKRDDRGLAGRIDAYFARRWAAAKIQPAGPADDAEYVRRVYLDLVGRIPSVAEVRAFLQDKRPDKRARLVERLLAGPGYVHHFGNVWRSLWMPEANTNFIGKFLVPGFENWLKQHLAQNTGYDQMVRELLTTQMKSDAGRIFNPATGGDPNPLAFYITKELKPENLAASTTRMFLGVRLECAQCHDHPFATWRRDQFWGMAAFFNGIERQEQPEIAIPKKEVFDRTEVVVPGSERIVQATFLDGKEPSFKSKTSPRVTLVEWMTAPDNGYFAKAAVNRLWAQFFGVGLAEPVDDMQGSETTAPHPELLDELAREFVAHKFDLKFLIRTFTASRPYQLTSAGKPRGEQDPHLFARMALRGMTPEQFFDSLVQATGFVEARRSNDPQSLFNDQSPRTRYVEKFANRNDKPTESQTSILQALALMNGKFIADATSVEHSDTLAAVLDAPWLNTAERVETLYLATLSRKPRPEELARVTRFIARSEARGEAKDRAASPLADVFWALLNSSEFILNH